MTTRSPSRRPPEVSETLAWVERILREERGIEVAKSKLAGTIRGSYFVIKGDYPPPCGRLSSEPRMPPSVSRG